MFINNECLELKENNGVDVLGALYTYSRVKGMSIRYSLSTFNCDHLSTFLMVGEATWTTYTNVSSFGSAILRGYDFPHGQLGAAELINIHNKIV